MSAPGKAEIRAEPVAPPAEGEVRVRAVASALSRGTERLIFSGGVPESEYERMRAPFMGGAFPFPVKYGYAMVGRVEEGPADLKGRLAFALYPHQTVFNLPAENIVPLPDGLPPERAVLAANMETALNAVWDGAPGPADRIAVVGAGVLGLLVARLCAQHARDRGDGGRYRCRRAPRSPRRSARPSPRPTRRRTTATSWCTPARRAQALRPRCGSPATRRPCWSCPGTARTT